MRIPSVFLLAPLGISLVHAWLPDSRSLAAFNATARYEALGKSAPHHSGTGKKIRGVNLGGWLIAEPWMMSTEWNDTLRCGDALSEFDCMRDASNVSAQNDRFEQHWKTWINASTVQDVLDVGLNTIRIPIGYWSYTNIVDTPSEHFPDGDRMLPYLDAVVQKASDLGIFVIMDLHGAPGAQQKDAFTGQLPSVAGFFDAYNYGRAAQWLSWMTTRIHTNPAYKSVGILEVLNEPVNGPFPASGEQTLTTTFYPLALKTVRATEALLGVSKDDALHVQYMDKLWGAGDPKSSLPKDKSVAFDDHNYVGYAGPQGDAANQSSYMWYTCEVDNRLSDKDKPKIVQEWSLTIKTSIQDSSDFAANSQNKGFYGDWFAAQQQLYEKTNGWVFWTWRTDVDYRWTYSDAVSQGVIPQDAAGLDASATSDPCGKWFPNAPKKSDAAGTVGRSLLSLYGALVLYAIAI